MSLLLCFFAALREPCLFHAKLAKIAKGLVDRKLILSRASPHRDSDDGLRLFCCFPTRIAEIGFMWGSFGRIRTCTSLIRVIS